MNVFICCVLFLGFSLLAQESAPISARPVNQDVHGDMRMSNQDGPTSKLGIIPAAAPRELPAVAVPVVGATLVARRGYDNNGSGANTHETVLTPANVGRLRKLFTHVLPGDARGMEAAPLIIPGIKMADGDMYDIALYATMANNVYAFDAHSKQLLWGVHLGKPVPGSGDIDGWKINENWGILSTPVYDPDSKTVYVVTWSDPKGNWKTAVHTIHALSVVDGGHTVAALPLTDVSYSPGHGLPVQYFKNSERKQRASLALALVGGRKTVFILFGTIQETSAAARGWVIAYDTAANAVGAAWTATSRYSGAGIWAAGAGPVVTASGDLYFMTGNGAFDGLTEWGESFIKLAYTPPGIVNRMIGKTGEFTVADWWSPWSDSARAGGPLTGTHITTDHGGGWDDMDLGSGGPTYLPALNLLLGAGKDGIAYVLDARNMGKTMPADFAAPQPNYNKAKWIGWLTYYQAGSATPADPAALNTLYLGRTHHNHSQPVWLKDAQGYKVFIGGENGNIRAWTIDAAGQMHYLGCSAEWASSQLATPGGMPGFFMTLSANGASNGLLFAAAPLQDANKTVSPGRLYAYSASNFDKYPDGAGSMPLLWQSDEYTYNKFDPPVVSGGYVYVPTYAGTVDVYGLR